MRHTGASFATSVCSRVMRERSSARSRDGQRRERGSSSPSASALGPSADSRRPTAFDGWRLKADGLPTTLSELPRVLALPVDGDADESGRLNPQRYEQRYAT